MPNIGHLRRVLADSWASNGHQSYFVEYGSPTDAVSLYNTVWWHKVLELEKPTKLQSDSRMIQRWLQPLENGSKTADGFPELESVQFAVEAAREFGIPVDVNGVRAALEKLRDGNLYSPSNDTSGDWGDTAVAVSTMRSSGIAIPRELERAYAAARARAVHTKKISAMMRFVVPVLSIVNPVEASAANAQLRSELQWIESVSSRLSPLARVVAAFSLRPLADRIGMRDWAGRTHACQGLVRNHGGAVLQAGASVDPHLTYQEMVLGCTGDPAVPPWTPLGWPSADAVASAVSASVDGARVARRLGLQMYLSALKRQLRIHWSTSLRPATPDAVDADLLAHILDLPPILSENGTALRNALVQTGGTAFLAGAFAVVAKGGRRVRSLNEPSVATAGQTQILSAIVDQFRYEVTGNAMYQRAAMAAMRRLQIAPGLYSTAPRSTVSVTATVVGAWIAGAPISYSFLRQAGLCKADLRCSESPGGARQSPLRIGGMLAALADPHDDLLPFPA